MSDYAVETEVTADPASCRRAATQLTALRKTADSVESDTRTRYNTFHGETSSGQVALALAGTCAVMSNSARTISDDSDLASRALTTYAESIDEVVTAMNTARSDARNAGMVVYDNGLIIPPPNPTDAQKAAWNGVVGQVDKARAAEHAAALRLHDAVAPISTVQMPAVPAPGGPTPTYPEPPPPHHGGHGGHHGSHGSGSSGGSGGSGGSGSSGGNGGSGGGNGGHGQHSVITQVDPGHGHHPGHPGRDHFTFTPATGVKGPHGETVYYGPTAQDADGHEHGPKGHEYLVGQVDADGDGPRHAGGKPHHFVPLPGAHGPHGEQLYVLADPPEEVVEGQQEWDPPQHATWTVPSPYGQPASGLYNPSGPR